MSPAAKNTVKSAAAQTVAVSGIGAATCFGPCLHAAAAARAGLTRFRSLEDHPVRDESTGDMVGLIGAPASPTTDGFEDTGRVVRLAVAALEDLQRSVNVRWAETAMFFALTPWREADEEPDQTAAASPASDEHWARTTIARIAALAGLPLPPSSRVFTKERTGTLLALGEAIDMVGTGRCAHALILASDTAIQETRLATWLARHRLKTPDNPVGLIPGEAAVAILLASVDRDATAPRLHAPVLQQETLSDDRPPQGIGIAEVMAAGSAGATRPIGDLYVDLNGDSERSLDLGTALARLPANSALRDCRRLLPALAFGETGAASPALAIALACRSFARDYAAGAAAMVLAADEAGTRASILIERPHPVNQP